MRFKLIPNFGVNPGTGSAVLDFVFGQRFRRVEAAEFMHLISSLEPSQSRYWTVDVEGKEECCGVVIVADKSTCIRISI